MSRSDDMIVELRTWITFELHLRPGKIARGSLRFAESTASERPSALTAKNLRELGKRRLTPPNGRTPVETASASAST